jgi:ribonucleoside-diphosphate reductase beta chain
MHQDFAVMLYHTLETKLTDDVVHSIVSDAVEQEIKFCTEACSVDLIGMNSASMSQYIRFVADRLLKQLGSSKLFHVANPFPWMDLIALEGKTNFFECRVSEYQKAGGNVTNNSSSQRFSTDAPF